MSRTRRYFRAKRMYEIIFRARRGLPLPARKIIELIIKSALARTQRDDKVILCHYVWMGNHPHIGCVALDAESLKNFYQELQKKITDALKRLLGMDHLHLWEGEPMVAEILDPDAAVNRIAYWYANPAQANLVNTISEYPGISTWNEFLESAPDVDAESKELIPWVRLHSIPKLPTPRLTRWLDNALTERIKKSSKITQTLKIFPNAWMKVFGITNSKEVAYWNKRVREALQEKESEAAEKRSKEGKRPVGASRLRDQSIMRDHSPKKKREKRIFVLSSIKELRIDFIDEMIMMTKLCAVLYRRWRAGDTGVVWPPGIFRPSAPPIASAI